MRGVMSSTDRRDLQTCPSAGIHQPLCDIDCSPPPPRRQRELAVVVRLATTALVEGRGRASCVRNPRFHPSFGGLGLGLFSALVCSRSPGRRDEENPTALHRRCEEEGFFSFLSGCRGSLSQLRKYTRCPSRSFHALAEGRFVDDDVVLDTHPHVG